MLENGKYRLIADYIVWYMYLLWRKQLFLCFVKHCVIVIYLNELISHFDEYKILQTGKHLWAINCLLENDGMTLFLYVVIGM